LQSSEIIINWNRERRREMVLKDTLFSLFLTNLKLRERRAPFVPVNYMIRKVFLTFILQG
jgi:hypothetical protein